MGGLDYGEAVKFAISWATKKESLKFALIVWLVSIVSIVLFAGAFLRAFGPLISSILSDPATFLLTVDAPDLVVSILPAVFLFMVLMVVLVVASIIVDLYILVLMNFFAFKSSNTPYADFPLSRLGRFFIMLLAEAFLVSFFWVHRKIWILGVVMLAAVLFAVLSLFNPVFLLVALLLFGLVGLAVLIVPLYLFFTGEQYSDAVVVNKYFLLVSPVLAVLVFMSILHPLFILLLVLLFAAYFVISIYCSIRVFCNTPVFLSKGTGALDSIKTSLSLTKGRASEVFAALFIGGIVSFLLFAIASAVITLLFSFAIAPMVPENIWGAGDLLQTLSVVDSITAAPGEAVTAYEMQVALESIRIGIVQSISESIAEAIVAPFAMLFGVFLTVGIYLQLTQKGRPKPAAPKKEPKPTFS
ncbi:MAG: hypothetical protein QGI60_05135 [archaeon]|nr:hypothetical protein [archaeon]